MRFATLRNAGAPSQFWRLGFHQHLSTGDSIDSNETIDT